MRKIRWLRLGAACIWLGTLLAVQPAAGAPPARPAAAAAISVDALAAQAAELTAKGRVKEAEAPLRQGLEAARRDWGEADARTAQRYEDLATNLEAQRRFDEAIALFRQLYDARREILGEQHRDTLTTLADLGLTLFEAGRTADAEPVVRRALAARLAAFGPDDTDVGDSLNVLGLVLHRRGRFAEAEASFRQSLAIRRKVLGERHTETLGVISNLGSTLMSQDRYAEAEGFLYLALSGYREVLGDNDLRTATPYNELAVNLSRQSRSREAEPLYRKSLEIRRAVLGEEHPATLTSYNNLGVLLSSQHREAEAEPMLRKVMETRLKVLGARNRQTAFTFISLGGVLENMDRADEAERLYREAVSNLSLTMGENSWEVASARVFLGRSLHKLGRLDEARVELEAAVAADLAALGPDHSETVRAQQNLATVLAAQGEFDQALAAGRAAAQATTHVRAANRAIVSPASGAQGLTSSFTGFINVAWKAGQALPAQRDALGSEAFGVGQELLNTAAGQAMAQASARVVARDPALSRAVRAEQDLAGRAKDLEKELLTALAGRDAGRTAALQAELAAARERLAESAQALDTAFPTYRVLTASSAISLKETQGLLGPRQGLLFLVAFGDDMYVMAASRDRFAWSRVAAPPAQVREQMALLRCNVDSDTCTAGQRRGIAGAPRTRWERKGYARYDLDVAHQLYLELVQPVEPALAGCDRLYVTTTSNLSNLPLTLLVTRPPPKGADLADPDLLRRSRWLGDRYALTVLPSVAALRLKTGFTGAAANTFEGFGDPRLGPNAPIDRGAGRIAAAPPEGQARGAGGGFFRAQGPTGELLADPQRLASLASLPGTRVELAAMARLFQAPNTNLTLGTAFTEAAFRAAPRLGTTGIVAIATHGILPSAAASIDEPGLVMTPPGSPTREDDGVLTASEAASLSLAADWVILSACNTASVEGQDEQDSLSSLSRAFLYAGAKALLASHWRVWDTSTAALTVETLRERRPTSGLSRSAALQRAMAAVRTGRRADGSRLAGWKPEWAHPSAWAAFSNIAYVD